MALFLIKYIYIYIYIINEDLLYKSLCRNMKLGVNKPTTCMLYEVNLNSNHSSISEFSSASVRVRHTRAEAPAHLLEFEVSMCGTSQFAKFSLSAQTRVWNDLPYTVFGTGMLDGFKGAVNRWFLP